MMCVSEESECPRPLPAPLPAPLVGPRSAMRVDCGLCGCMGGGGICPRRSREVGRRLSSTPSRVSLCTPRDLSSWGILSLVVTACREISEK